MMADETERRREVRRGCERGEVATHPPRFVWQMDPERPLHCSVGRVWRDHRTRTAIAIGRPGRKSTTSCGLDPAGHVAGRDRDPGDLE